MDPSAIASLETLGTLEQNQFLHVLDSGQLTVDQTPGVFRFLVRKYRGDSRQRTLTCLKNLVSRTLTFILTETAYLYAVKDMNEVPAPVARDAGDRHITLKRITDLLTSASQGITNLRTTYTGDPLLCAELQLMENSIADGLPNKNEI